MICKWQRVFGPKLAGNARHSLNPHDSISGGPLTLVIERPDGVEFRRAVLPDQGAGGRSMTVPLNSAVPTGTWRARAFTDPKGASVGETTFMVEDYIPDRIDFTVSAKEKLIKAEVPVELKVDGHFLYGAPASGLQLEGDMLVAAAASGRPGYPGYQFGVADEETGPGTHGDAAFADYMLLFSFGRAF